MFDRQLRRATSPALEPAGALLAGAGVRPAMLTGTGFVLGAGACVAAANRAWVAALVLWLANRLCDGLDGPVARARGSSELGGFLDIVADFAIYGGFVVGVAIGVPSARLACLVLLFAYYVSGTALLALSSLLERRQTSVRARDERSVWFAGGLAEGAETIVVYVLFCLLPGSAEVIAWSFAGAVAITALQRVALGARVLGRSPQRTSTIAPQAVSSPQEVVT
jgi:phosphatidylglycerophosphate synthase